MLLWSRELHAQAFSGMLAWVIAITMFYPLETLRLRMQIDSRKKEATFQNLTTVLCKPVAALRQIIRAEGWEVLYLGLVPTLWCIAASNYVFFFFYEGGKLYYRQHYHSESQQIEVFPNVVIAFVAGSCCTAATCPMWVVGMRLKVDRQGIYSGSMLVCLQTLVKESGWGVLLTGIVPSLWLVGTPVVQYVVYEQLKWYILAHEIMSIHAGSFVVGAISKVCATLAMYPLQVVQVVLRTQDQKSKSCDDKWKKEDAYDIAEKNARKNHEQSHAKYSGTVDCLLRIFATDGFAGLYRGLSVKIWQAILTSGLMFMLYEHILMVSHALFIGKTAA
jgi:adenine nucleotide transporter 17